MGNKKRRHTMFRLIPADEIGRPTSAGGLQPFGHLRAQRITECITNQVDTLHRDGEEHARDKDEPGSPACFGRRTPWPRPRERAKDKHYFGGTGSLAEDSARKTNFCGLAYFRSRQSRNKVPREG